MTIFGLSSEWLRMIVFLGLATKESRVKIDFHGKNHHKRSLDKQCTTVGVTGAALGRDKAGLSRKRKKNCETEGYPFEQNQANGIDFHEYGKDFSVGIHCSPRRGVSSEFSEHALYAQDDKPRHLDCAPLPRLRAFTSSAWAMRASCVSISWWMPRAC